MGKGNVRNTINKKELLDNLNDLPNGVVFRPLVTGVMEIIRGNTSISNGRVFEPLDLSRILRVPSSNVANFDVTIPLDFNGPGARKFMIINESIAIIRIAPESGLTLNYSVSPFVLVKNTLYEIYRVSINSYVIK